MPDNGVDRVEAELRETRAHLDETLTELEHKLTPAHAVETAKDFVSREAERAGDVVRTHPLATGVVAMIAAAALRRMSTRRHRSHDAVATLQALLDSSQAKARQSSYGLGDELAHMRSGAGQLAYSLQNEAGSLAQTLQNEAGHLAQALQNRVRARAHDLGQLDLRGVRRGLEQLEEQPLLLGGAMLVLGLLAGRFLGRGR